MTTLREAATQALEALEDFGMKYYETTGEVLHRDVYESLKSALAEEALQRLTDVSQEIEAALAEPVQEPVAWRWGYRSITTGEMDWRGYVEIAADPNLRSPAIIMQPLYAAPPQRPAEPVQEPQCNPHPKAPHGFLRNASHTEDRYVCECEYWEPYEAGYQAGMEAALRAQS